MKKEDKITVGFLAVLLIGVWGFVFVTSSSGSSGKSSAPAGDSSMAWVMAQGFLEDHLKSPSSAKYPWGYSDHVTRSGNTYNISAWVDAENSFGAKLRQNWQARVVDKGSGNWSCEYLALGGQVFINR